MDHDQWISLGCLLLVITMMGPSTIDKARRKMRPSRISTTPDNFFDEITEFQNDFA